MRRILLVSWAVAIVAVFSFTATPAEARVSASLRGSPASMTRQHSVAEEQGYTFVGTSADVDALVEEGKLFPVDGGAHYTVLESVSFPYARPELRLFIERLAEQYHEGTGEKLVVTSLTRPTEDQPWNAHPLSVHPAGLAVDLRVSRTAASRRWLEGVLLKLERQGLLDATRERNPPHYHIALFPDVYRAHVADLIGPQQLAAALRFEEEKPAVAETVETEAPVPPDTVVVRTAAAALPGTRGALVVLQVLLAAFGGFGLGYWYARKG